MTLFLNSLKQSLANSTIIPSIYSLVTKPFSKKLQHKGPTPNTPKIPQKVTVIIPNYNYKDYLDIRLKTILNQTYPLYELIILDDASTDGSADYIENELLPKARTKNPDLKVRFIKNEKNSGKSISQWRKAFKEATGDFLWIAEADDFSDPCFLSVIMDKFHQDSNAIISFTNSVAINSRDSVLTYDFQNKSVDKLKANRFKQDFIINGEELIKQEFAINCVIPNVSASVFRLDKSIPYDKYLESAKDFTQCGDWYFYLQILRHGKIAYSRPALNYFRIHKQSATASSKASKTIVNEVKKLHEFITKDYNLSPEIIRAQYTEEQRILKR